MPINKNVFIHEDDKAALKALESIPGFSKLVKLFMSVWSEKLIYIDNMAGRIRISEKQLPEYYHMLLPICEKLGIEVPDMFLELNVQPNAYTSGDTHPCIVLTSGLIETLPDELIATVIAHECGHIACHHVLYRTIGTMVLNGGISALQLGGLAIAPLRAAFSYWMRCSEFSADRAAILCDGTADKMIEVCIRLAGFGKNIGHDMNMDAFMEQAQEYKKLMEDDSMNKAMEFLLYTFNSHPINVVRAYEAKQWAATEDFRKAIQYYSNTRSGMKATDIPAPADSSTLVGRNYESVKRSLYAWGFSDVTMIRDTEPKVFTEEGAVLSVKVNGHGFEEGDWLALDAVPEVTYYLPMSEEEIKRSHVGKIQVPYSAEDYTERGYLEAQIELLSAGFRNVSSEEVKDIEDRADPALDKVAEITIDKISGFNKGDWFDPNAEVKVYYHGLIR